MNKPHLPLFLIAACFALGCISVGNYSHVQTDWSAVNASPQFSGWIQRGGKASYRVEDGVIIGQTRPNQPNSFLCTLKEFSDFELEYEFLVDKDLNSGVQIRSHARDDGIVYGYQVEIDPSPRAFTAGIYEESGRGWLKDLKDNPDAQAAFKQGEWNRVRVIAQKNHIQTWLNGVLAADLYDSQTASGFIALQVHNVGDKPEPLEVRWRNIRIRELTAAPAHISDR